MTDVAITTTGSSVVEGVLGTSAPATGQGVDTTLTAAVAELAAPVPGRRRTPPTRTARHAPSGRSGRRRASGSRPRWPATRRRPCGGRGSSRIAAGSRTSPSARPPPVTSPAGSRPLRPWPGPAAHAGTVTPKPHSPCPRRTPGRRSPRPRPAPRHRPSTSSTAPPTSRSPPAGGGQAEQDHFRLVGAGGGQGQAALRLFGARSRSADRCPARSRAGHRWRARSPRRSSSCGRYAADADRETEHRPPRRSSTPSRTRRALRGGHRAAAAPAAPRLPVRSCVADSGAEAGERASLPPDTGALRSTCGSLGGP